MRGLYIHVPFCTSKCPYCDFYSVRYSRDLAHGYKDAVIRNIDAYNEEFDTVYFGGGTPVLLWREICDIIKHISFTKGCEVTIETNPCCTTKEALISLRESGVNRLSVGVQSFNDNELQKLGRRHTAETAINAVYLAKELGYDNISIDLMLGTPAQTLLNVEENIKIAASLPITHVSAYMLKVEPNTPFGSVTPVLPDDDAVSDYYLKAVDLLERYGFHQYEISNFAKSGYESSHNLKYWRSEEYLGIGPAAHSYYCGNRFYVNRDLNDFINSPLQKNVSEEGESGTFEEYAMLKLRLREGLSFSECIDFGVDKELILKRLSRIPKELIVTDDRHIELTKKGFLVSNSVISEILGY